MGFPIIGAGIAAAGALGGLFGAGGKSKRQKGMERRFDQTLNEFGQDARSTEGADARSRLSGFDPHQSFLESVKAGFSQLQPQFAKERENLFGQQVRMGRLRSGFGFEDVDRLRVGQQRVVADMIGNRALDTAGLDLRGRESSATLASGVNERAKDRFGEFLTAGLEGEEQQRGPGFFDFLQNAGGPLGTIFAGSPKTTPGTFPA